MEDGIEQSISILLDTMQRIKPSEKKQETPTTQVEEPKESNDKKEKRD